MFKKWWKYSKLRYYVLNAKDNYDFWLRSKKIFKTIEYKEIASFRNLDFKKVRKKRFVGYQYKGKIYLDNPGIIISDRDVWKSWKKKNLF